MQGLLKQEGKKARPDSVQYFYLVDSCVNDMYDYRTFLKTNKGRATLMNENRVYTIGHTTTEEFVDVQEDQ
ncbi:MAG: hypothetical protein GY779_06830 [Gammaproteobacteria bacterium]|nr:hypothetical protein [Gammaproteobacteria bacterium]